MAEKKSPQYKLLPMTRDLSDSEPEENRIAREFRYVQFEEWMAWNVVKDLLEDILAHADPDNTYEDPFDLLTRVMNYAWCQTKHEVIKRPIQRRMMLPRKKAQNPLAQFQQ